MNEKASDETLVKELEALNQFCRLNDDLAPGLRYVLTEKDDRFWIYRMGGSEPVASGISRREARMFVRGAFDVLDKIFG